MTNPIVKYIINNHFLAVLLVIGLMWCVAQLSGILILVFVSFIIMAALTPFTDFLVRRHFPRILAVIIPYSITIAILVLLILPLVPFLVSQIQLLFKSFPKYIDQLAKTFNLHINSSNTNFLGSDINTIGMNALSFTGKIFSGVFSALTVFVVSFYFMLQREKLKEQFASICPKKYQQHIIDTIALIENKIGYWLRGQLILCFSIGFCTWVGLALIGLPYALPLALFAGILEIVPTIGPIVSAIPATIVALTISPGLALSIVILYIIIQALENNLLVPKIMEKAVGLNPIAIILGVLIGGKFLGIIGALLAIPSIAMLIIIVKGFKSAEQLQ